MITQNVVNPGLTLIGLLRTGPDVLAKRFPRLSLKWRRQP